MGRIWKWSFVLFCLVCAGYPIAPAQAYPDRQAAAVKVGDTPQQVFVSPNGRYAYVTNSGADTVSVIDLFRFTVVGDPISVGNSPFGAITNRDGSTLYVTNQNDATVSAVDLVSGDVTTTVKVGTQPQGMALAPDGSFLYVTSLSGTLSVVQTSNNTVDQTLTLGLGASRVIYEPVNNLLYVDLTTQDQLVVLNQTDLAVLNAIGLGTLPVGLAAGPDGKLIYVVGSGGQVVSVIDADTFTLKAQVPTGLAPQDIALTPDGSVGFVTNTQSNTVTVFDAVTYDVLESNLTVGDNPGGIAATPDGRYVLVANRGDNTVSVITEGPFITIASLVPSALNGSGANQATLTWQSDMEGSYQVEAGGDGTLGSGTLIATGNADANRQITTVVPASSLSSGEGTYEIFVYVTGSTGAVGRTSTPLVFDTVPPTVPQDVKLGPGGTGRLDVSWSASTDTGSGVANYRVFFGTSPGVYDGSSSPVDAGDKTSTTLSGLSDGNTYYVAVSAVDGAGNESAMSAEVSGSPVAVYGSTGGGGCFIRTVTENGDGRGWAGPVLLFLLAGAVLLLLRRKPGARAIFVLLCIIGGSAASVLVPVPVFGADLNATGISWTVQAGYFQPTGDKVKDAYDAGFTGKFSFLWKNATNFETALGLGLTQSHGSALDAEGSPISGTDAELLFIPADFNIRYRFQFQPLQSFIPYLGVGFVGGYYKETLEGGSKNDGFTYGIEGLAGCRLNMMAVTPQGMTDFSRNTGAKNVFLFLEGNYSRIDRLGSQDFDLGGLGLTAGVEIQY